MNQETAQDIRPGLSGKMPHACGPQDVTFALDTGIENGLTTQQTQARQRKFGPNRLARRRPASVAKLLLHQFESPVVLLLVIAAAVAFGFGEWKEAIAIGLVLLINGAIGFVTGFACRALHGGLAEAWQSHDAGAPGRPHIHVAGRTAGSG